MFEKYLNEEKLNELSFPEYVNWMRERAEVISITDKRSYWEAKEIISNFIKRYSKEFGFTSENYHSDEIGELLRSAEVELKSYTLYAKTKSAKAEVLAIFKSDIDEITWRLLWEIKNQ